MIRLDGIGMSCGTFKDIKICEEFIHKISKLWPRWFEDEDRLCMQFIADVMKSMNIKKYITVDDLYTLSLGQKQRIMIAEILAKKPKYIILDEPTTMIDSEGKEAIYKIIRKLKKQGYGVICITNLADEILLADRTLILNNGTIEAEIKKDELIKKAYLLEKFNIRQPTLLKILTELNKNKIKIDLKEFTVDELVKDLKGRLNNEKCN